MQIKIVASCVAVYIIYAPHAIKKDIWLQPCAMNNICVY